MTGAIRLDQWPAFVPAVLVRTPVCLLTAGCWLIAACAQGQPALEQESGGPTVSAASRGAESRPSGLAPSLAELRALAIVHRAALDRIRPALVTIESFGGVSAIPGVIGGIRRQGEGNTTGVMITPDGWIATSTFNFVQSPPVITVVTSDGQRHLARLAGRDNTRKFCLLKIDGRDDWPVPEMAAAGAPVAGQGVLAIGVGFGDANPSLAAGIISALDRAGGRAVQTDARTSPANYGGPLVDLEGRLVGICVPLNPQSAATAAGVEWYDSGIGFAIPVLDADWIERLKEGATIEPALLGVVPDESRQAQGVLLAQVQAETPAARAGLAPGTIVLAIDGRPVSTATGLRQAIARRAAGDTIVITYLIPGSTSPREASIELAAPAASSRPIPRVPL